MGMAENIKFVREDAKLSQREFAARLGVTDKAVSTWENGTRMPRMGVVQKIADMAGVKKSELIDGDVRSVLSSGHETLPSNGIPYKQTGLAPIVGSIPAGIPSIADCVIEGYAAVDVSAPEEYYWLRVNGDSMVNAGIQTGDLVLIHVQNFAETGQIVACRVNGDEATLKRYRQKDDQIFLIPENPNYEPYILKTSEFETGRAAVMGVAVEIKRFL